MPIDKPIRIRALVISLEGDRVWVAFQYERLLGLCFNCGLLGNEAKVCTMSRIGEGKESPYGDWLRVGFFRQKEVRGQRIPSPPRRNMEEHIRRDKNPPQSNSNPGVLHGNSLTVATVIEPRTSNGNSSIAVTVTEIVDNELAIIPGLDGYDSQLPCTSEINERNPKIMVHTDVIGIEHKTEKNDDSWISVPIMYEENLVDNTLPISSKFLPDLVISSLSHDQARGTNKVSKWRKIKNLKATSQIKTQHASNKVRQKRGIGSIVKSSQIHGGQKHSTVLAAKDSNCKSAKAVIQPRQAQ